MLQQPSVTSDFTSDFTRSKRSKRAQGHEVNLLPDADLHEDWWILLRIPRLDPIWRIFPAQVPVWSQRCGPSGVGPSGGPGSGSRLTMMKLLLKRCSLTACLAHRRLEIWCEKVQGGLRKSNWCSMYLPKYCNVWQALWCLWWPCLFLNNVQLKIYGIGFSVLFFLWFHYTFTMVLVTESCFSCFNMLHLAATQGQCQARGHKEVAKVHGGHQALWPRQSDVDVFWKANTQGQPESFHMFSTWDFEFLVLWIEVHGPRISLKQRWSNVVDREICQVQRYMFATNCVCNTTWWDTWRI